MKSLLSHLKALGFTEYESKAYLTLLKKGPLNGYQLAKHSGIPRPNVYTVLDHLQEKGAVLSVRVKDGVEFTPQAPEAMFANLSHRFEQNVSRAAEALKDRGKESAEDYAWNIKGYDNVIERAKLLISSARSQITAALWSQESKPLAEAFSAASARGVQSTVLCVQGCPHECGACRGHVYRYPVAPEAKSRWFVLAVDQEELLVGQASQEGEMNAANTRQEAVVGLAVHYVKNSIAVAEIVRSLGPQLLEQLDPQALAAIRSSGLSTEGESWFDHLYTAVKKSEKQSASDQ